MNFAEATDDFSERVVRRPVHTGGTEPGDSGMGEETLRFDRER